MRPRRVAMEGRHAYGEHQVEPPVPQIERLDVAHEELRPTRGHGTGVARAAAATMRADRSTPVNVPVSRSSHTIVAATP